MAISRGKRWNGNVDALPADFLKDVLEKMDQYGERVQFSLVSGGSAPSYQIQNMLGKTIAFDRDHHLLRPQEEEFADGNATPLFSIDQIKSALAGERIGFVSRAKGARVPRSGGSGLTRAAAARLAEQQAAERYAYFKAHRSMLPATIAEHTEEIDALMRAGKPADEAFGEVMRKYY